MLSVRTDAAAKRLFLYLLLFSITLLAFAQQNNATKPGSWSGVLVSSACNADEAFNESPECTRNVPGAKLALYDDTNRVMYGLEPQEKVVAHLGDTVTIRGTLDSDKIQLASIELMSIGLAVGQKAPAFSVRDQFGRTQTLDTLKGANGTVLSFFALRTGDPSAKGSWSSCKLQFHDSKSKRSSWRPSATTRKKS
jgi:hypothetical protein